MDENQPESQPLAPSLAGVTDAELFRYVTYKNLIETALAMQRRARELRPTILTMRRCAWFEVRSRPEAADELAPSSAMQRLARELRPTILATWRCAWSQGWSSHEAADELARRTCPTTETRPESKNQPPTPSLAAVTDAQLFKYVTYKNLVENARAMKRRARELRPTISTMLRCAWFEVRFGREASAELTRRTASRDLAESYADVDPAALLGERVIFRASPPDQQSEPARRDQS